MRLFITPRSHFARKVRILAAAMELPLATEDVGNIGSLLPNRASNPLGKVPVLLTEAGESVYDSDHIARHLVRHSGRRGDEFDVLTQSTELLNRRALMNSAMAAQVELVLGGRAGLPADNARFDKLRKSLVETLHWLEGRPWDEGRPSYGSFHLVALLDYTRLHSMTHLERFPSLTRVVSRLSELPYVAASAPPPLV